MLQPSARRRSPGRRQPALQLGVVTCGIVLAACLSGVEARAAQPARLEWVRLEGADSCIDRATLEARVKRRLGTEPFDPRASRSIEGVVQRTGGVWRAQILVRTRPDEANPPRRELASTAADCQSLGNAVVLAVALAIDPAAAFSDPAVTAPPPPPAVVAPKPPPPEPPPIVSSETMPAGRAELMLASQLGLLPKASLGLGLGVATALTNRFELGLRARAFPEVKVSGTPSYAVGLAALTLQLCGVPARGERVELRACAGPSLGLLHASVLAGDRTQPGQRASLTAEVGLDAAFTLTGTLAFELGARAAVPVTRYRFTLEGSDDSLFTQSVVAGMALVGLELRFGSQP
jgi:hypothetical protein